MPGPVQTGGSGLPTAPMVPVWPLAQDAGIPFEYPSAISGQAIDQNGNAVVGATLKLMRANDTIAAVGITDASGNYRLGASTSLQHRIDAYLAGSPDIMGTTVNTLVGS